MEQEIFKLINTINYISIFELLLKFAIPAASILLLKSILESLVAYILIRVDKYISIGIWVTIDGFKGQIKKLDVFNIIIQNDNGDTFKISTKDVKKVIYHKNNCS